MSQILSIRFQKGNEILTFGNEQLIKIREIRGISASEYSHHTKSNAQSHGSTLTGTKIEERVMTLGITIDDWAKTELLREQLIHFFNPLTPLNMIIDYRGTKRSIVTYVKKLDGDLIDNFWDLNDFEITLLSPDPFFNSLDSFGQNIAQNTACHAHPLSFLNTKAKRGNAVFPQGHIFGYKTFKDTISLQNDGDVPVGIVAVLEAKRGQVTNPKLINKSTGEFLECRIQMKKGDTLTFNTNKGKKRLTLLRNGIESNVSKLINKQSNYFSMNLGMVEISYDAQQNKTNLDIRVYYTPQYLGV